MAAVFKLSRRNGGYRMGTAPDTRLSEPEMNNTKAALILANPMPGRYRRNDDERRARRIETTSTASLGEYLRASFRKHPVSVTQQILALANLVPAPTRGCPLQSAEVS